MTSEDMPRRYHLTCPDDMEKYLEMTSSNTVTSQPLDMELGAAVLHHSLSYLKYPSIPESEVLLCGPESRHCFLVQAEIE